MTYSGRRFVPSRTLLVPLGCPCGLSGCSCGVSGLGEIAGEIGGIRALEVDIRRSAATAQRVFGTTVGNPAAFSALMERARAGNLTTMTSEEAKQFVLGALDKVAGLIAKMKQLSQLDVSDAAGRERVQSTQAQLLRTARDLWSQTENAMRNARPAGSGTSGLGVIPLAVWAVAAVVSIALVAGGTYYYTTVAQADADLRAADHVCETYNAGRPCSPEEFARIRNSLSRPDAMSVLADRIGTPVGIGVGVGAGLLIFGMGVWFWRKTRRRRRLAYVE